MKEPPPKNLPLTFHSSFFPVCDKLKQWMARFPLATDNSLFNDLTLLYILATQKFLDHRNAAHLFRLTLSIHLMKKKLFRKATFASHIRHLQIRWIPTNLVFPFVDKPVLGCLIGFNLMDRYELFDEENIVLALQKYLPQLRLVKESSYCHNSEYKNLKIFYFEIEKKNGHPFSLFEKSILQSKLQEKVKSSIQPLSPTIFMGLNDEEIYKNVLVLSQEIQTLEDLPQANITLEQQTGKEIIFRVNLVHISPFHRFSLKDRFPASQFVSQRVLTVKHLEDQPIEAHVFKIHLPREAHLLRSDGSLDFYSARQKVVALIRNAIGDFRDYNGGIILKQQELLSDFKASFFELVDSDPEALESFFYALLPLEKQVSLPLDVLTQLFNNYLESRKEKFQNSNEYSFKTFHNDDQIFICVHGEDLSLTNTISEILHEQTFNSVDYAYNLINTVDDVYFNCVFMHTHGKNSELWLQIFQDAIHKWHEKIKTKQVLRIGLEYSLLSLDPRIGGETVSGDILRLLYEGLTRFNIHGSIEGGVAEFIELSANSTIYTFKLRHTLWNDGTPMTAHDFEYAWKKILSPDFKTSFAYLFYLIKNAKEAKEGKLSLDSVGIKVLDDRTLRVELIRPASYFLQSTAHPLFSPIHRVIDQQYPQWPYYSGKNYPCNGPFQLTVNEPNHGYQLDKNPLYWDSNNIALDQITLTSMTSNQANISFQNKEVDWIGNPFGAWHPLYSSLEGSRADEQILTYSNSIVCWCVFNTSNQLFKNLKLRQAFAHAIQRSKITANAFLPLNPAYSALVPFHKENPQPLYPEHNPELARQLFEEFLQEQGLLQKNFPCIRLVYHEKGIREYTAKCLQEQFKEYLGIDVELMPLPWNALFNNLTQGTFELGLMHWTSWIDDLTYTTLNAFKSSKEELNFSKWENPQFREYLSQSEQEPNPFQQSSYLKKAEEILSHEMPVLPLFYQPYQAKVNKDLQVVFRSPCGPFNIAKSRFYKKDL